MSLRGFFDFGEGRRERVVVSERLRDGFGGILEFIIRGLSEEELKGIEARSEGEFIRRVIAVGCIEPTLSYEDILRGLLPGEALFLYRQIIKASGLDMSFSQLKGEVSSMLMRGEGEAVYACLAAFEMGIAPLEFLSMSVRERACIGAFIDEKIRIKNSGRR